MKIFLSVEMVNAFNKLTRSNHNPHHHNNNHENVSRSYPPLMIDHPESAKSSLFLYHRYPCGCLGSWQVVPRSCQWGRTWQSSSPRRLWRQRRQTWFPSGHSWVLRLQSILDTHERGDVRMSVRCM